MLTVGALLSENVIPFARLCILKLSKFQKRESREVNYCSFTFIENLNRGHLFQSDSGFGFKCFETKACHTLSHNGDSLKVENRKEITLASH